MINKRETKQFWDQAAKATLLVEKASVGMLTEGNEYNAIYRLAEEEAHFLNIFSPDPTKRVLEVGSGGGRWAFFLANKVSSVVGIDFSESMIEIAEQQRAARKISNVSFVHADLLGYNEEEKFDLIYFSGVLQYVSDEEILRSIEKASELLTPGGVIISRDTVQENRRVVKAGDYPVIYRTISEYRSIFEQAGFTLDYNEFSYPPRRFSHFISNYVYSLPFISYEMAFCIQSFLIGINNFFGNPRWLMKKHHRDMLDAVGNREHRFFRYRPT